MVLFETVSFITSILNFFEKNLLKSLTNFNLTPFGPLPPLGGAQNCTASRKGRPREGPPAPEPQKTTVKQPVPKTDEL